LAQASHISAQTSQTSAANSLPLLMNPAARRHIEAQSISSSMHRARALISVSSRHEKAQWSQAIAQELHASMQD
jgi:hypothetical protein